MLKIGKNLFEWSSYSCQPKTNEELKEIIKTRISKEGLNCDLNDIDVSLITDMSYLFYMSKFNGDISKWITSNVENMCYVIKTIYLIKNHFKSKKVNFALFAHISMHKF